MGAPGRRITMVSGYYPPHLGGVEGVAQALAIALRARGHEVQVLTTDQGARSLPARSEEGSLMVRRCRSIEVAHTPLALGIPARLAWLPSEHMVHVHVAQAFLPESVWVARHLGRRPYVVHFHMDVDPTGRFGRLLPAYKRSLFAIALRGARAVVVLTTDQARFVATEYGVRSERIHVVPNGVGEDFLRHPVANRDHRVGDPTQLVFVGRLAAQKNLPRLIGAVQQVSSPVELTIVGEGDMRRDVEHLVSAGRVPVRLVGELRDDDLRAVFDAADAFVLASDREGMPLAAMEAMATGLPVVATNVPGTRELVSGVGILAEPTERALASAINRLCADPQLRVRLGQLSRERAQSFSWGNAARQMESVYAACTKGDLR
jgi:glycosyltransferase involved in cell wall biosynthesis